ncbi:MAG: manganese efflux pump [Lachnospiraceae bacterium]|nr:manganese efflux pump [Lachnospiraceae bacterium]
MRWNFLFFLNSILFGAGLAMDAFSVSMANGLHEPHMKQRRRLLIAGTFGVFQTLMPLIGWLCIRFIEDIFVSFRLFVPWIALALLLYIGIKMLIEGLKQRKKGPDGADEGDAALTTGTLILQGIATSIDALSVGFTIAAMPAAMAVTESVIIGVVTFGICLVGLFIGRKFGTKLEWKASVLGGVILIAIGIEIFVTGLI